MQFSPIEWTHYTANPLRYRDPDGNVVHACIHKSGGCLHCYAETLAKRWGRAGLPFTTENMKRLTPFLDEKELDRMFRFKPASGKMCFLGDMTDIFGEWVPVELIAEIFNAMAARPDVNFQILTKRADRMHHILSSPKHHGLWTPKMWHNEVLPNVWLGVSCENQTTYKDRVLRLANTPAAVRFISFEPLLEDIGDLMLDGIFEGAYQWAIIGGESGPGARPMQPEWARSIRDQCVAAEVPFFFKQWGGVQKKKAGRLLDGREWNEFPGGLSR